MNLTIPDWNLQLFGYKSNALPTELPASLDDWLRASVCYSSQRQGLHMEQNTNMEIVTHWSYDTGFKPAIVWSQVQRSTNWATQTHNLQSNAYTSCPTWRSGWRLSLLMYQVLNVFHIKDPMPYPVKLMPLRRPVLCGNHWNRNID